MNCDYPSWIIHAIDGVLFIVGFLCIVLMQKAEHDQQINRIDSKLIRNGRRLSFIAVTLLAWITASTNAPLAYLLLFVLTAILLIVDIVGLGQRPPNKGYHYVMDRHYSPLRRLLTNVFSRNHD